MQLSRFGEKVARASGGGIARLMRDLGEALAENPELLMLGGGNPAVIPAARDHFQQLLEQLVQGADAERLYAAYQDPQGERSLRRDLAVLLQREYDWALSERNIVLCNGSQSAFFLLFNLLAGPGADGVWRTVHLPLLPEYVGYADAGMDEGLFSATRPAIELVGADLFKYRIATADLPADIGALCVSRPTNPSGNVLSDTELQTLLDIADARSVPLIIDGAYGQPFPGLCYSPAKPVWDDRVVLLLSLSKLGLPGLRTGIVIASEPLAALLTAAATVTQLASGNVGTAMAQALVQHGSLLTLGPAQLVPYYRGQLAFAQASLRRELAGLPFRMHVAEGGMFVWLWLPGLPVSSQTLYERLKVAGLLVVPGEPFFIGVEPDSDWPHARECLRISCAQPQATLERAAQILGETLRAVGHGSQV